MDVKFCCNTPDCCTRLQNGTVEDAERDVYDYMLTQAEIQGGVNDVNAAVNREIAEAKCKSILLPPLSLPLPLSLSLPLSVNVCVSILRSYFWDCR